MLHNLLGASGCNDFVLLWGPSHHAQIHSEKTAFKGSVEWLYA